MATNHKARAPSVGGGLKKVLYTLETVRRMGVATAAKALQAKNACKACGLGMGGQRGGMTNELGEFPAVCNKSVQAQSTDIQPPIPAEVLAHSLGDLRELSERELASLGRLDQPLIKAPGANGFEVADWTVALDLAAQRLCNCDPQRAFFYSSGRSSNEAGFLLQLFARLFGTNNVNNCSYYCHQATSEGLAHSVGTGTATVELADLEGCDLIFLFGANPASNHPRLVHQLKACRDRGGSVIVVNPARESGLVRFAVPKSPGSMLRGGTEIASEYLQPRIGSDIAVVKGLCKAVLERSGQDQPFITAHTRGFEAWRSDVLATPWSTLVATTGLAEEDFRRVAARYCAAKHAVFAWGMGLTHHLHGVANVESVANLALLRGMVGKRHAGLLPLRGHSNVQGIGTIGVKPVLAEEVIARIEAQVGAKLPCAEGLDTMAAMQAAAAGEIDAAVVMGGNLYGATPNSSWASTALDRIGFKLFLTTTLNQGHLNGIDSGTSVILPVTARDEEWQPTTQESMFNFVRLSDGGIRRLDNVRPESWVLCELAERVLPAGSFSFEPFKSHRRVREAIAASVPGMAELASIDVAKQEFHVSGRVKHTPEFATESGRASFSVCELPKPVGNERFPYTLATVRSEGQFNTIVYEDHDSYRGAPHRWCVLIGPEDLARLGVAPGDRVTLRSAHGVMPGVQVHEFPLPAGDVLAYFPEANVLTGTGVDARSKTPAFKSTAVAIEVLLARPPRAGQRL